MSLCFLLCLGAWCQVIPSANPTDTKSESPKDTLGRTTPREAVLSFLSAARKGNFEIAALYLNTPLRGEAAQTLAHQLAVVLDRRLPARLNLLSDEPEGSIPDPLKPNEDIVGTISTADGDLDIVVERVDRGKMGRVWLFSKKTLDRIPEVFQELRIPPVEQVLPQTLIKTRLAGVPLFEWLAVFVGLPLVYLITGLLGHGIGMVVGTIRRQNFQTASSQLLSPPIRLLLLAVTIRWLLGTVGLTFLARQFWLSTAIVISVLAVIWMLLLLNGWGERRLLRRLQYRNRTGSASVLRLSRRLIDVLILSTGILLTLRYFGVNITAALAGLGVGGIAVALAAQKTLENVIGGVSLIADQALRVGDTLKIGDISGTVEDIGLRSTRIRTMDRTMVTVPNGQIAGATIETLSARDKYWFHHVVGVRFETQPEQVRDIVSRLHTILSESSNVEKESARVRFLQLGGFSLNIDIFCYILACDWNHFLKVQEELLLRTMTLIRDSGAQIAFPSQTMYLSRRPSTPVQPAGLQESLNTGAGETTRAKSA